MPPMQLRQAKPATGSMPSYSVPPYKDDMGEHCVTILTEQGHNSRESFGRRRHPFKRMDARAAILPDSRFG